MNKTISKGDRVTVQLSKYFDGTPVKGWPDAQFVGEVLKVEVVAGCVYAKVKYQSGRKQLENVDRLTVVA